MQASLTEISKHKPAEGILRKILWMGGEARGMQYIKKLDEAALIRLQALEKNLESCIVALEKQPQIANLFVAEIRELQSLEQELHNIRLAHKCKFISELLKIKREG